MRWRHPWPRTLLWRFFLLIALLISLSLFAWFQILNHFAVRSRATQAAQLVISMVNLTRSALLAADETRRISLVRELANQEGIRVIPAEEGDKIEPMENGVFMQTLVVQTRTRLGNYTRFSRSLHGQQGFFVSFRLDEEDASDEYWLMLPPNRVNRAGLAEWVGWSSLALLFSLLGAYLLVLGVTRPLKALENAARVIGRGEHPLPLSERGPREIAEVARAFNQMSHDLTLLESDRALILAGVSHDLRTPLARLRLGIELSGATSEDLAAMSADIDDMDRIINQFLDFARDTVAEPEQTADLAQLTREAVESFIRRGAPLDLVDLPPSPCQGLRVLALRRAVTNLVDNALKYSAGSPVNLRILCQPGFLGIEVADRGPGIPPEHVDRLKRPFTRLEDARSNVQGSGLGLAIVDRIARLHGGHLDLLEREGGGLRAILYLANKQ
ncbi:ATP-binding protein [Uliginosibacterium gangwonense]|uniref:ATP-binding protein n=1 Tax=Uliginosibacterium gangwonense TaxID=392736 RepID=UPI00036FFFDC|nr:ATP-binding protein [Uliginosibacterium gangwonense]